ncbi:unnamed protein product [Polarella glacialis]|uniref:Uncharacterized protein n=1 Tax=Polarella glacialis TaxID=89957 RepID=A0A813FH64_POLGL|nr:unnamed protein product [Polarella glacialis]CAE8611251.1 unnamed protein product [Polarella glacialis]
MAHRAERLYEELQTRGSERDRVRLLSAGGSTSGSSLVSTTETDYTDAQWREALRWRLGLLGPAGRCRNVTSKHGEPCDDALNAEGDHAINCMTGPVRQAVHAALADVVCEFIEEAGGQARREAYVKEFQQPTKSAFLDVWGWGAVNIPDLLVDVTWRHPMASRYLPGAARQAGHACRLAAADKEARYPASGGRAAHVFCVEGWGRLGAAGEAVLDLLAGAAAAHDRRRGRAAPSRLHRWRARIDAVVQRGLCRALEAARFGLPGEPPARRGRRS